MSKDIDKMISYMKSITNGDKELEKYLNSLIVAIFNEPISPIKIELGYIPVEFTNSLMSDVRKKYG